jgi:NAD(P)H dehydrogenase (quinone)
MSINEISTLPRHIVVLAHPDPRSFNATVAQVYCETVRQCGQYAVLRDLYAQRFDPVLRADERPRPGGIRPHRDVLDELDLVRGASVLSFIYPIWFGAAPAILTGYVDRVLGSGLMSSDVVEGAGNGPCAGSRLMSMTSSATRTPWLAAIGQTRSMREFYDQYLRHAFGMTNAEHVHFGGVVEGLARRVVDEHLHTVAERTRLLCAAVAVERRRFDTTTGESS